MAKKLSLLDSGWLMMETRETPMHVAGLQLFATPEDAPDDYFETFYRRLLDVPAVGRPFNMKLRTGFMSSLAPSWVEDRQLDLEYHVRHAALPRPGRVRELLALVSRLHAQRLDRSRPLWECYLIEGLEGNRFAVYSKLHHAMVDGVAGARLMAQRLSRSAGEQVPAPWSAEWDERQQRGPKAARAKGSAMQGFKNFGGGLGQFQSLRKLPRESNAKTIYRAPKTPFNRRVTGARRFAAQSWSLARIKAAGKRHGGTVNDVFLAMCAGALRQYLISQDALPVDPLVTQVPVALRSADQADEGGNAITAVQVSLATHVEDPVQRLKTIQESMQAVKDRLTAMNRGEIDAFTVITNLPLTVGQMTGISGRIKPMFNLVISNVPGPKEKLYLNGAELQATYPVSLVWHGYGVNITVQSYGEQFDIGIIACRDTVPQVQRMLDYFEQALAELE